MNIIKATVLTVALLGSSMLAFDSDAGGRYYGGGRGYGHHHHGSGVGLYFGLPAPYYYYPSYSYYPGYYPPAYYPPAYYAPAPAYPPTYIEQSAPVAAPAPSSSGNGYWYYCRDSQTYYPYVQQCASQWQQVAPNPGPRS